MEVKDRFKQIREKQGLNQSNFAKKIGLSQANITDIERGRGRLREDTISKLYTEISVNLAWLLTGEGEMFLPSKEQKKAAERPSLDSLVATKEELETKADRGEVEAMREELAALKAIVYREHHLDEEESEVRESTTLYHIGKSAAGVPIELADFDPGETVKVAGGWDAQKYYVADVVGSSMVHAGIHNGDMVILEQCDTPVDRAIMLCYYEGQTTLKLLRQNEDGNWELRYRDGTRRRIIPREGEDWRILGRFVEVARLVN